MPVIPQLERWRQENQESETNLGYPRTTTKAQRHLWLEEAGCTAELSFKWQSPSLVRAPGSSFVRWWAEKGTAMPALQHVCRAECTQRQVRKPIPPVGRTVATCPQAALITDGVNLGVKATEHK